MGERLQSATSELLGLEQAIVAGGFSPRILSEFRNAVDSIRQTARVVQGWIELQQEKRDPYAVIDTLSRDRVRRAIRIAKDLTLDLQSMEVDYETEGLAELLRAIETLREGLMPLVGAKR
jgi:hypothetical protein